MKVLVLSTMYPNSVLYLSGIFVHEQVKQLKQLGVEVVVAASIPYSPSFLSRIKRKWELLDKIPEKENFEGVELIHNKYIAIPGGHFKNLWAYEYVRTLKKNININEYDLIHAHGSLPDDFAAFLLSREFNKPYIVTVHGATVYAVINKKRHFNACKKALENANKVVSVSSKVSEKLKTYTSCEKNLEIILNGFTPVSMIQEHQSENKITILFGGTLVERKGTRYLIAAFAELTKVYNNIELVIAGGGEQYDEMQNLVRNLVLEDSVKLYGVVEHKKMLQLMANCDIFILPSWNEAFGVVYLEAMSLKKPIIGSYGEGIEDIINHKENGLLCKVRSSESIKECLKYLIENKSERERIALNGYQTVKELTWENNAKKYLELYNEVMNEK